MLHKFMLKLFVHIIINIFWFNLRSLFVFLAFFSDFIVDFMPTKFALKLFSICVYFVDKFGFCLLRGKRVVKIVLILFENIWFNVSILTNCCGLFFISIKIKKKCANI